jgi:hypothetical protein
LEENIDSVLSYKFCILAKINIISACGEREVGVSHTGENWGDQINQDEDLSK